MLKVTLKIKRGELSILYFYSNQAFNAWSDPTNRPYMLSMAIQLAEHYERIRRQAFSWQSRDSRKEYTYTLPVSLAWSYHHWLQKSPMDRAERDSILAKLDKALIDCHLKPQNSASHG